MYIYVQDVVFTWDWDTPHTRNDRRGDRKSNDHVIQNQTRAHRTTQTLIKRRHTDENNVCSVCLYLYAFMFNNFITLFSGTDNNDNQVV